MAEFTGVYSRQKVLLGTVPASVTYTGHQTYRHEDCSKSSMPVHISQFQNVQHDGNSVTWTTWVEHQIPEHKKARLQWAKLQELGDWKLVIWSHDFRFCLYSNDARVHQWPHESFNEDKGVAQGGDGLDVLGITVYLNAKTNPFVQVFVNLNHQGYLYLTSRRTGADLRPLSHW